MKGLCKVQSIYKDDGLSVLTEGLENAHDEFNLLFGLAFVVELLNVLKTDFLQLQTNLNRIFD